MSEGIRKVNEFVIQLGRTLIVNDSKLKFENFSNGTLFIDENASVKVKKKGVLEWTNFQPSNLFVNKSITHNLIADQTITNQQIALNTILNANIKDFEITTQKLANNSIVEDKVLDGAITNRKIKPNSIENISLLDKTIQGNKIADNTIASSHFQSNIVQTQHLLDGAVTSPKIADRSIISSKIATNNILTEHYADNSIITSKINDYQITTLKIADSAVTTSKVGDFQIIASKLGDGSVISSKIGNSQVTSDKIAASAVTSLKIADGAITTSKLDNASVTSDKLSKVLNDSINASIRLEATGIANVNGSLYVRNNITASGTISASKIYNAVYNDLAEGYVPGEKLLPGDVVEIREDGKVYKAKAFSSAVVGVISNEYAACYGATEEEIISYKKVPVGLIGKIHVNVFGPIKIGQSIVPTGNGLGSASSGANHYGVVGKALETSIKDGVHKVLCLVFPN